MSDIITFSSKVSSLLDQVMMLDNFICSSKVLLTRASDDVRHHHLQLHSDLAPASNLTFHGIYMSLLLACYGQTIREEGDHLEFSNITGF